MKKQRSQNENNELSLFHISNLKSDDKRRYAIYALYGFEWMVALFQAFCDYNTISSSFLLRDAEKKMITLSDNLSIAENGELASQITTQYFNIRKEHRKIIRTNRHWIYYSLACDITHLLCRIAETFLYHDDVKSLLKKIINPREWTLKDFQTIISHCWCSLLSISLNSIWYNLFVVTPSYKPKGITKVTMDVLNAL